MDFPGRLIAAFLAAVIITIVPLQYIARTAEESIDSHIAEHTEHFSDTLRKKGYLDIPAYEAYIRELDASGQRFDLEIEDIHPVTGKDVAYQKEKPAASLSLFAAHVHTDACYSGHRHKGADNQKFTHTHAHTAGKCRRYVYYIGLDVKCSSCGASYYWSVVGKDMNGNNIGTPVPHGNTCWECNKATITTKEHNSYTYSCGYDVFTTDSTSADEVAFGVTMAYPGMSYPQNTNSATYNSGCYSYHQSNDWHSLRKYSGYGTWINQAEVFDTVLRSSRSFCDIPARYEKEYWASNRSGLGETKWYEIDYAARVLGNYNVVYDFKYYGWYSSQSHPKNDWPSGISGTETAYLFSSFHSSIERYAGGTAFKGDASESWKYRYVGTDLHICGFDHSLGVNKWVLACGQAEDTTYDCDKVVMSISPLHPVQTVKKGESIITRATAVYMDGHTGTVDCTSNYNPNLPGVQTVTLTYSGLVGDVQTTGKRTCTVSVTVIDKTLQSLAVTPPSQTVPLKGTPSFTVTAYYSNGTSAVIPLGKYSVSAYSTATSGQKTITFTYTEEGVTKTATAAVYVDNLLSISAIPEELTVEKYTAKLPLSLKVTYLYSSSKTISSGYSITGYNPSSIGKQKVTASYTDQGTTVSTAVTVNVTPLHRTCPQCQNVYEMNPDDTDPGCPICRETVVGITVSPEEMEVMQGEDLPIIVRAMYRNGAAKEVSGWSSNYDPDKTGLQPVTVEYGGYAASIYVWVKEGEIVCPVCQTHYPAWEDRCPVCREKVTGIQVNPEEITVNQYDEIILQVLATYADGLTSLVTDWSIDRTSQTAGVFTATISYQGFTAQVKLTVLSASSVTCPVCGLVYDAAEYPNGCPVCSEVITGIEAYLSSGSRLVQYGTLPQISVSLIYLDTHREIIETGFTTEGFDPFRKGVQTILVRYLEFSCTLEAEVVDALGTVTCPNGHIYYLNEDGTDPGCPFCAIGEGHEVILFYEITYLPEILEVLYTSGIYYFDRNNYLTVRVTKRDTSLIVKLQQTSAKLVMLGRRKRFTYGGEVL